MTTEDYIWHAAISLLAFTSVYLAVRHGWAIGRRALAAQERRLDWVLNHELLLDVSPRLAIIATAVFVLIVGTFTALVGESLPAFVFGAAPTLVTPVLVISHLETRRRQRLDQQIVDGITSLASGVRAGLTLVQSIQLLVQNATGPIQQEFAQLMREYELGVDLSAAMHNAANRIGSSYYRLLFAAVAAHRQRGGDMGQSLDRIADSIREIQRLEGRLTAMTAQGRAQARFIGIMPFVILVVLYLISPDTTAMLFTEPIGRLILLGSTAMIVVGFLWIKRIMTTVDI